MDAAIAAVNDTISYKQRNGRLTARAVVVLHPLFQGNELQPPHPYNRDRRWIRPGQELKAHFKGETTEVGLYLAMSKQAEREGHHTAAMYFRQLAMDEAWHASEIAEILGMIGDTKANLEMMLKGETMPLRSSVATLDIVSLVHVPPKEATFMGTKWLPGSVSSAGLHATSCINHHKLIDLYYSPH